MEFIKHLSCLCLLFWGDVPVFAQLLLGEQWEGHRKGDCSRESSCEIQRHWIIAVCPPCATILVVFFPGLKHTFALWIGRWRNPRRGSGSLLWDAHQTWSKEGMNTTLGNFLQTVKNPRLGWDSGRKRLSLAVFLPFCSRGQRAAIQMPTSLGVGCIHWYDEKPHATSPLWPCDFD